MTTTQEPPAQPAEYRALRVETNGIEVIAESDRKGTPRQLFWPWFGSNVSVFGIAYGAYALGFKVSFVQALVAGLAGLLVSFLLCGLIALAGKRGSAPTMVLSRAAFGVDGNRVPALLSWIFTVGWETVLTILATLATTTVFHELGWSSGTRTKLIALVVVAALVILGGFMGFDLIMRLQTLITVVTGVLTVVYMALVAGKINWSTVSGLPGGSRASVAGCVILLFTAFGLSWVNLAADYSRYLPRYASTGGVVWWTTMGGTLAPAVLFVFGLLLAGSSAKLSGAIGTDPIGALATQLPTWALIPFLVVAVLGLVGGAVLDIYSSGLALLTAGVRIPRPVAALVDGVLMVAGSVYVLFYAASSFFNQFQGFLITLGVPVAAWCGVMLADIALRRRDYSVTDLFARAGRYGRVRTASMVCLILGSVLGWGLVTNTYASWLQWQGYLLGVRVDVGSFRSPAWLDLGGKKGEWAGSNLGVPAALVVAFVIALLANWWVVRRQERVQPIGTTNLADTASAR